MAWGALVRAEGQLRGPAAGLKLLTGQLGEESATVAQGPAGGTVHGGMLATFADVASTVVLWDSYDSDVEQPITTDMHVRYPVLSVPKSNGHDVPSLKRISESS